MRMALRNARGRPDHLGRILIDFPALVAAGQMHWLCLTEGTPEPEVLVAYDELGRLVGVPTGRDRPCPIPA